MLKRVALDPLRTSLFVLPIAIVGAAFWMWAALSHFEHTTGRARAELIGTNHTADYSFAYYPGGQRVERIALYLPAISVATVSIGFVAWSLRLRTILGWRRVAATAAVALAATIAIFLLGGILYLTAVSIFI